MVVTAPPPLARSPRHPRRNPGPSWGYRFLRIADRVLPEAVFRPLRAAGTWVAMWRMPSERAHSRAYLARVLGRPPTLRDVFRHFFAFEEALMVKLRFINGRPHQNVYGECPEHFREWLEGGGPVLLGTFHVGLSDLLGCQISGYRERTIGVVRLRVGNSHDTDMLAARFGGRLRFVWVNEPAGIPFALKEAAESLEALALQCDRIEYAAKTESFEFLGERRRFPFTLYHLAWIFRRPVLLSVGLPRGADAAVLHSSPRYEIRPGESRDAALARARAHFQDFLHRLEAHLRANPYQWFNFIPLNPPEAPLP